PKPTSAPASVEIVLFPPDNRIRDLDNYNKALFDALTHAGVWEDDSQVKRMLGTVAKLAMRQPFVLFKGLTFQKLCLPGAFRPGDHHN
ncbi:RusA family crossover junction endodeoxyribonuclease, partial [Escherichia coli]|nr:RusA family crossover junction endodeoxyribonuclease [Escherichia coli]MCV5101204.1 RusA family crossover junction endodeoxyribonuclease [Escherichia coli]